MGEHGWAHDVQWEQCDIRIGAANLLPTVAWGLPHHKAVPLASNSQYISIYIFYIKNLFIYYKYYEYLFVCFSLEYLESHTDFCSCSLMKCNVKVWERRNSI